MDNQIEVLKKKILSFTPKKILVFGDVFLDQWMRGHQERLNPESSAPLLRIKSKENIALSPGGAGNAAHYIHHLGSTPLIVGLAGKDLFGHDLLNCLKEHKMPPDWILQLDERPTIVKMRIEAISKKHPPEQKTRVDIEYDSVYKTLPPQLENQLKIMIQKCLSNNPEAIIISDYNKGTISKNSVDFLKSWAKINKVPLIVNAKPENIILYTGATLITLNESEARESAKKLGQDPIQEDFQKIGLYLQKNLQASILLTRGADSSLLFHNSSVYEIPTTALAVYNISGAGDMVIAAIAISLAHDNSSQEAFFHAVQIANLAAGVKVSSLETRPISWEEVLSKSFQ